MTLMTSLTLSLALVLLARPRGGEARVRLNSIRTVILREGHALPVNRSAWEPSLDLTLYQCMSDLECSEGSYCHAPPRGPAHSRCHTCRRRKRRCHRDGMCCPGNRCSNNVCVAAVDGLVSQRIPETDGGSSLKKKGWRKRTRTEKETTGRGQVGDPCLRSSDCSSSLCCARHFWTRICKPVLREGQVCTRSRRKSQHGGLELFQRCSCGEGLGCRALREPPSLSSSSSSSSSSSPSSSSSLLAAAAKSRHASAHSSLLSAGKMAATSSSSSSSTATAAAKTRLHVCQRN